MFDKKILRKIFIVIILILIIIIAIILIRNTLARYESNATSNKDVDVAFWFVDNSFKTDRLLVEDIYPSDVSFDYTFTVSNYDVENAEEAVYKKAETDLSYEITITTTTNLPLEYEIQKNGTTCTKIENIITDSDGTYYKQIKLETDANALVMEQGTDITDTFVIKVKFPKANYTNTEFADLIESIKLDLTAKQII